MQGETRTKWTEQLDGRLNRWLDKSRKTEEKRCEEKDEIVTVSVFFYVSLRSCFPVSRYSLLHSSAKLNRFLLIPVFCGPQVHLSTDFLLLLLLIIPICFTLLFISCVETVIFGLSDDAPTAPRHDCVAWAECPR